jgi:alpha-1,6-mannosyltransferase
MVAARGVAGGGLVVCDVALFYAERSGGIRTYLNEKARFAAATGAFEHHLVVPGRRERHEGGRHELRSLQLATSNGYLIPFGSGAVRETLRAVRPDVVILHDPFWRPLTVTR